jgi:hypothetical protein
MGSNVNIDDLIAKDLGDGVMVTVQEGSPELEQPGNSGLLSKRATGRLQAHHRSSQVGFFAWRLFLALTAAAVALISAFDLGPSSLLGTVVGVVFVLAVPGTAVMVWWPRGPVALWYAVCAALSISITLIVGQGMLTTGLWHPSAVVTAVAVASAASLVAQLIMVGAGTVDPVDDAVTDTAKVRRPKVFGIDISLALAVLAAAMWIFGLRRVDPNELSDSGLIQQLSPVLLASFVVLAAAVVLEIYTSARTWVLALLTATGVLGIFGLQTFSYAIARVPVAWLHWGFSEQIARDGSVLEGLDSRYSWPGFFAGLGMISKALGITDPERMIAFAPIAFSGLAILAFFSIATTVLGKGSARWLAVWIYLTANWVGQEYLSPQGITVVIVLVVIAIVLEYGLRNGLLTRNSRTRAATPDTADAAEARGERLFVWISVAVGSLALAPTHQLSPLFLILTLGILLVSRKLVDPLLILVPIVAVVLWYFTGASAFWVNYGSDLLSGFGDVSGSLSANVGDRLVGDSGRRVLLGLRVGTALIVFVLAAIGLLKIRRNRWEWRVLAALCLAPFAFIVAQAYGGEMLLRSYLFALPALALGAACALSRFSNEGLARGAVSAAPGVATASVYGSGGDAGGVTGRGRTVAVVAFCVLGLFAVSAAAIKGQNDSYVAFSARDLDASEAAYDIVQPGERLSGLTASGPLRYQDLGTVDQRSVESVCPISTINEACVKKLSPDVLVVTPSEDNSGRPYGRPAGWTGTIVGQLVADGTYVVAWHAGGDDATGAWVLEKAAA